MATDEIRQWIRSQDDTQKWVPKIDLLRLCNDADRLAQIERQVRELADAVDDPDHPYGNASGDEIRAVLDPGRGDST